MALNCDPVVTLDLSSAVVNTAVLRTTKTSKTSATSTSSPPIARAGIRLLATRRLVAWPLVHLATANAPLLRTIANESVNATLRSTTVRARSKGRVQIDIGGLPGSRGPPKGRRGGREHPRDRRRSRDPRKGLLGGRDHLEGHRVGRVVLVQPEGPVKGTMTSLVVSRNAVTIDTIRRIITVTTDVYSTVAMATIGHDVRPLGRATLCRLPDVIREHSRTS